MGRLFPTGRSTIFNQIVALLLLSSVFSEHGFSQILPPGDPRVRPPPPTNSERPNADLEKMQNERWNREKASRPPAVKSEEKRNLALLTSALENREMNFMIQVSLIAPYARVSKGRKNYNTDVTSHFHMFFRGLKSAAPEDSTLWWGLRAAMFSGTGIYKNVPGRFGFTYFGPMIGLGRISPGALSSGFDAARGDRVEDQVFPTRHGWFWMFGVAAVTRISQLDPSEPASDQDFDRSGGVKFDKPGLWTEITYTTVHFGAVGINFSLGTQLAQGKVFSYLGLGAAGWN